MSYTQKPSANLNRRGRYDDLFQDPDRKLRKERRARRIEAAARRRRLNAKVGAAVLAFLIVFGGTNIASKAMAHDDAPLPDASSVPIADIETTPPPDKIELVPSSETDDQIAAVIPDEPTVEMEPEAVPPPEITETNPPPPSPIIELSPEQTATLKAEAASIIAEYEVQNKVDPKNWELTSEQTANRDYIFNFFANTGEFDLLHISAALGNAMAEDHMNSRVVEGGVGPFQFDGPNRTQIMKLSNPGSIQTNMDFLWQLRLSGEKIPFNHFFEKTTIKDASYTFMHEFERPNETDATKNIREYYSAKFFEFYINNPSSSNLQYLSLSDFSSAE